MGQNEKRYRVSQLKSVNILKLKFVVYPLKNKVLPQLFFFPATGVFGVSQLNAVQLKPESRAALRSGSDTSSVSLSLARIRPHARTHRSVALSDRSIASVRCSVPRTIYHVSLPYRTCRPSSTSLHLHLR